MPVDVSSLASLFPSLPRLLGGSTASANSTSTTSTLAAGQIVAATVVQNLDANRLIATIGGQNYDLRLPIATTIGETLQLEVVSTEPEPSFRLLNTTPGSQGKEQNVTFSDTARLMQSASATLSNSKETLPARLRADPVPLAQESPAAPAKLADNLKSAISQSGFFYESHQAQWVKGNYSLEALRQEPQASPQQAASANVQQNLEQPNRPLSGTITGKDQQLLLSANQTAPTLVEHQIAALGGAPIEWYGQAWPGQPIHVSIQRDKDPGAFDDPSQKGWESHLTLDLPNLGTVDATMHLSATGVRITINAAEETSTEALRTATRDLVDTLEGIGIKVLGIGLGHGRG
ncbi:MAG: flagellar hook-length control protein FliK [Pseudomonadota bacterium]